MGCIFDESVKDVAECRGKVGGGRKVNSRGLKLECVKVLPDALLIPVLLYGNETIV